MERQRLRNESDSAIVTELDYLLTRFDVFVLREREREREREISRYMFDIFSESIIFLSFSRSGPASVIRERGAVYSETKRNIFCRLVEHVHDLGRERERERERERRPATLSRIFTAFI